MIFSQIDASEPEVAIPADGMQREAGDPYRNIFGMIQDAILTGISAPFGWRQ
jgi:hypothetical protein